jgi:osmotically-inducible protein OsmY
VVLARALALAGCKSFRSSDDPIVRDQEIIRDIKWGLQKDARFADVLVACDGRVVTLTGRVTSAAASADAGKLAEGTRDVARVVNRIEVRPK